MYAFVIVIITVGALSAVRLTLMKVEVWFWFAKCLIYYWLEEENYVTDFLQLDKN